MKSVGFAVRDAIFSYSRSASKLNTIYENESISCENYKRKTKRS